MSMIACDECGYLIDSDEDVACFVSMSILVDGAKFRDAALCGRCRDEWENDENDRANDVN